MNPEEVSARAIAAVERKTQGATDFGLIREIAEFLDGTLYTVGFTSKDGSKLQSYVYFHDKRFDVYAWDYELLQAVANPRRSPFERLLKVGGITGSIAVALTFTVCAMAYTGKTVPGLLENALTIVIGFYFGTKVDRA